MGQTVKLDGSKWNDDDIVITGISARLPNSDSVEEFRKKLLAKVDLITDEPRRFQNGLYGAIKRYGLLKDLSKFDAKFFNIHPRQAERMDPQIRNLLEVAYEATVDAGLHPEDLRGTKTGVVVGVASSETQDKWSQMPDRINGYEYTGCTRTMFANRVSHYLDIKGPSYSIDTASSTTLVAFQQAYDMIKDGVCDACFVCGTDLVLNPCVCLMFQCLNMLSPEGKCKAFDIGGDGYVRSEGVIAVLLQKAKSAKRIYANVLAAGSNCDGYKDEGITFPSGAQQVKLFRKVAQLANVDPTTIDFMEAHGSATRVGDPQEMNAVTEVFANGRKKPLRTGSIKSNMGHGEPASALSAVIKVCVAMECGIIPPNLHYNIPNPDIPALLDGRLNVITEPTPWDGGLVAVNSFGVGGANGHALLLSNKKAKKIVPDTIPRLICVSGVTESAVENMLNKIYSLPRDPELYALLNNVHRKNIKGHEFRGYMIVNGKNIKNIQKVATKEKQNLCMILPGIETKWKSIDNELFNLEVFDNSIKKCEKELKSAMKSINLTSVLKTFTDEKSPLNITVAITALQIGLIDVLRALDVSPDYIIGFNIGEIAAGYADDRYTLQQAILCSYYVGYTLERLYYPSSTAVTDMPRKLKFPADVSVCAKISPQCTYVSGAKQSIQNFIQAAKGKGFNAREVDCFAIDIGGILRRSGEISKLTQELEKILENSKQSTDKWLTHEGLQSTSNNCVQDLVDCLTNASPIQKALNVVGKSALLQISFEYQVTDFQNSTPRKQLFLLNECATIWSVLSTVGQLYNIGFQPQIQNIYPKIQFPVSHGTPMIQSMIEWNHSETWNVVSFAAKEGRMAGEFDVVVDFDKEEFGSLPGNFLNKCEVFPKSFHLYLLWKTIGRFQNKPMSDIPLVIENMFFIQEAPIPESDTVKFTVNILETTGKFEIRVDGCVLASGHIRIPEDPAKEKIPPYLFDSDNFDNANQDISKDNIYKQLNIKQYHYNDTFKQLQSTNSAGNVFMVKSNKWCTLLETLLQIPIFRANFVENSHSVISFVRKITIDPRKYEHDTVSEVKYNKKWNTIKCNAVEVRGVKLASHASRVKMEPELEYYDFVPFIAKEYENAAEASLMLALENWTGHTDLKIAELINKSSDTPLILQLQNTNPSIKTEITLYSDDMNYLNDYDGMQNIKYVCKDASLESLDNKCHIVVASNVLNNAAVFKNLLNSVRTDGCILLQEDFEESFSDNENVEHISTLSTKNKTFILLKKVMAQVQIHSKIRNTPRVINVSNLHDCVQKLRQIPDGNTLIVVRGMEVGGVAKFVKCVIGEIKNLSIIFIEDKNAPLFSLTNAVFADQLKKNFPFNVYRNGTWGVYLPLTLTPSTQIPVEDVFVGLNYKSDSVNVSFVQSNSSIYKQQKNPWNVKCSVHYATINMRDRKIFNGNPAVQFSIPDIESQKSQLGLEFSGFEGDKKVFGLVTGGALATSVIADADFLWNVPETWSLQEAVTVPYSYVMAYYALCIRGSLKKSDSILIIGDNGIARAATHIALQHNINVFVLINDHKKKLEFGKCFPQMKQSQIISSIKDNFYLQVLESTASKGVDTIFVTVPAQTYKFQSYVSSLAENGNCYYFDNVQANEEVLGSSGNMRCITFHRITPTCVFENGNVGLRKKISELIKNGLNTGVVQPLPYIMHSVEDIPQVLKYGFEESNDCKMVVNIREDEKEMESAISRTYFAQPRTYFSNNKYYIIRGALEEFGSYVTNWMITQGVRNAVFVSTNAELENKSLLNIYSEKLKSLNCNIKNLKTNDFSQKNCQTIVEKIAEMGVIGGVFDFTQFEDPERSCLDSMNDETMKILGHKTDFLTNMDVVTRKMCQNLEYFVSFSNVEFEYGASDKSFYCYANGTIQNLMRNRKNANLCATLIQWGPVGESPSEILYNALGSALPPQTVNSALQKLHCFLQLPHPVVSSYITTKQSSSEIESKVDVIMEGVAKFLGIKNPNNILPTLTMLELGLDSLIGTDIQQYLEINYGVVMCTQEVRELTFEKLKKLAESL